MAAKIPKDWMPLFQWHKEHYSKQNEFVDALKDHWEVVFVAGNGTGKTHMLYWNLHCFALGIHPYQFAPPPLIIKVLLVDFEHGYGKIFTETSMMDQTLPNGTVIRRMLPDSAIKRYPTKENRTLDFKNGSLMFFQTSEQKKKQHSGTNFDILGCDEEPEYSVYDESKRGLRTAKGGGRILHSFTPPFGEARQAKGPTWTKFKLVDPFEKGEDSDVYVVRAAMSENPAITPEYIRKFSKGKTEEELNVQLYGQYPPWGTLIHPKFQDHLWDPESKTGHLLPYDLEVPFEEDDILFEMATDWHSSKAPAIIWTFEFLTGPNKGDVVAWDEMSPAEGKGMTIMQIAKAIREHEGWRNMKIRRFGEPKMRDKSNALISGFNAWDEFRHCGIRFTEGWNRQPGTGISIINDFLQGKSSGNPDHPRLFVKENLKTLRHNLKNHYWVKKGSGEAVPDPKFSDYCVSLRYILQGKSRKIKKSMHTQRRKWPIQSTEGIAFGREYVNDYNRMFR